MRTNFNPNIFSERGPYLDLLNLNRDEASTLYFALRAYHENIVKDIENSKEKSNTVELHIEDTMFLGDLLQKVGSLLFDLIPQGTTIEQVEFRKWLDVI